MFGISIFSQPEHFISLCIGLFELKQKGLAQLSNLLTRTKNPPISAIYTYELLQQKSWQEYGLDIIRYLSQLSDLSQGSSMSSSLQNVIGESSFLTQIRHNLTHKIKISDYLIGISRNIILKQIKDKYWDNTFKKYMSYYRISLQKINQHYERIFDQELGQQNLAKIKLQMRTLNAQQLTKCSNYEFKQFFPQFYQLNKETQILNLIKQLQLHKKAIAISYLIRIFCNNNKNEQLCHILIKLFKLSPSSLFSQQLIITNLKRLTFIHYLGLCSRVLNSLPNQVTDQLASFWQKKQETLQKKHPKAKIYKLFKPIGKQQ